MMLITKITLCENKTNWMLIVDIHNFLMSLGIWFHDRTYKNIENDEKADYQNGLVRKSLRSELQFPTTTSNSNSIVQNITESGVDVVEKCAQGQKVSICVIAIADNWTHTDRSRPGSEHVHTTEIFNGLRMIPAINAFLVSHKSINTVGDRAWTKL